MMAKYYKVSANGVSKFIEVDNVKALKRMKRDFDGKLLTKNSVPVEFSSEDLFNIQKNSSSIGTSVDKVDISSIFKTEDTEEA